MVNFTGRSTVRPLSTGKYISHVHNFISKAPDANVLTIGSCRVQAAARHGHAGSRKLLHVHSKQDCVFQLNGVSREEVEQRLHSGGEEEEERLAEAAGLFNDFIDTGGAGAGGRGLRMGDSIRMLEGGASGTVVRLEPRSGFLAVSLSTTPLCIL